MISRDFFKAGHWPTLFAAFFYFDMSFVVWILLGPLAVQIAADLHLDPAQKGLMVALPVLVGAVLRVVNGVLVDRLKPKGAGHLQADHRQHQVATRSKRRWRADWTSMGIAAARI
jgi:NNP family nitrate/nitrite transporter-like MFS transporter